MQFLHSTELIICNTRKLYEKHKQFLYNTNRMPQIFPYSHENNNDRHNHLTSVTVEAVMALLVYFPRPWVNFKDLYNLRSLAVQYLLQISQSQC